MPTPQKAAFTRPALAPGLLAAIALIAGVVVIDSSLFVGFRYVIAVLALIVIVFAYRGRGWVYLPFLAAIAVCWNPVEVIPIAEPIWQSLQFAAALVFVIAGVRIKVPAVDASDTATKKPRNTAPRGR